jgi:hypothetical protein
VVLAMTPEERKAGIRKVILDHLKSKGYPNMTRPEIVCELPEMWEKLDAAGLILSGWYYADFEALVLNKCLQAQMAELFKR